MLGCVVVAGGDGCVVRVDWVLGAVFLEVGGTGDGLFFLRLFFFLHLLRVLVFGCVVVADGDGCVERIVWEGRVVLAGRVGRAEP